MYVLTERAVLRRPYSVEQNNQIYRMNFTTVYIIAF